MENPWNSRERQELLLSPRRERWFPRSAILQGLALGEGMAVADVGAGGGYLVEELALAVGQAGQVWAVDPSPQARALLTERFQDGRHPQVAVCDGTAAATSLAAATADRMVWMAIYHELLHDAPKGGGIDASFAEARRVLKPGGLLAIGDWRPVETEIGPPVAARVSRSDAGEQGRAAGFTLLSATDVSDAVWLLVLKAPAGD